MCMDVVGDGGVNCECRVGVWGCRRVDEHHQGHLSHSFFLSVSLPLSSVSVFLLSAFLSMITAGVYI